MKKLNIAAIGVALYSAAITTTATAATIDLPQYGFTIEALDAVPSTTAPTAALMMFLPAEGGFAPNLNVNIQPYAGNIESYISMSKDQFKKMNWVIVTENQNTANEWTVEYTGQMQGNDLHFYARAVSDAGKVYLVTASAKESQWTTLSGLLRKHVNSFKTK